LQARPLLDLELRLGEASGAVIAVPLLQMACKIHNEMATFEQAKITVTK
jgi:nicotinate-nucleotide--dimethylbenzimidazole phosphoribosyltransferase